MRSDVAAMMTFARNITVPPPWRASARSQTLCRLCARLSYLCVPLTMIGRFGIHGVRIHNVGGVLTLECMHRSFLARWRLPERGRFQFVLKTLAPTVEDLAYSAAVRVGTNIRATA